MLETTNLRVFRERVKLSIALDGLDFVVNDQTKPTSRNFPPFI